MADIFEKLNCLNLKLQGKDTNIIQLNDNVKAFVSKLKNWQRKVHIGNIAMFDSVSCIEETGEEFEDLRKLIVAHLQSMECEFQRYFPELEEQEAILIENPFSASLDASGISDEIQDQYFDLQNDSSARILYHEKSLFQFWCEMYGLYPELGTAHEFGVPHSARPLHLEVSSAPPLHFWDLVFRSFNSAPPHHNLNK